MGGCAPAIIPVEKALDICARGATATEVTASGTVERVLGVSTSPTGTHLGFLLRTKGLLIRVEHNESIGGSPELSKGAAVSLQGQYECNDGVIHYTHHDPRGRHISGYIITGGKIYR